MNRDDRQEYGIARRDDEPGYGCGIAAHMHSAGKHGRPVILVHRVLGINLPVRARLS